MIYRPENEVWEYNSDPSRRCTPTIWSNNYQSLWVRSHKDGTNNNWKTDTFLRYWHFVGLA